MIHRLTFIERTLENVRSVAIDIKSHNSSKKADKEKNVVEAKRTIEATKEVAAPKTTYSRTKFQMVGKGEEVSWQQQANDAHRVAEAN